MFHYRQGRGRRPRRPVSRFADYLRSSGNGGIGRLILASGLLLAIAALGAVGLGLFTRPAAPATAAPAPAGPAREAAAGAAGLHFGAVGGYGCRQSAQVRFGEYGQYTDGISGFVTVRTGGWARQGCDGRFDAMPMSGNATRPDPSNYALWTFRTGVITRGSCQIAVFVPTTPPSST